MGTGRGVAKTRPRPLATRVHFGARVNLYMAARKWDMAAAVASHLVKVDPETAGWWISFAHAIRRSDC